MEKAWKDSRVSRGVTDGIHNLYRNAGRHPRLESGAGEIPKCSTKAKLKLKGEVQMKSTDNAGEVSAQTTTTKFDGVLVTIRSRKSFFEVTQAIERTLPRFHIPN
jgi:hypothetical protein